ncbi:hypothetical protein PHIM7_329 [Sinorhizobium phage phiM7]|uniref:Uncharacterized protein n=2 Tax=Emdodecavirus TaxID=1980937 RepID=S5MDJ2_9CAUD|nr:hypothetical protein AB690_gp185 [Sinorhizobium phage phiM12]YP_009601454.1 hypothetical protein FDH46_gp149 [Sinorhizobium phage phiM7]AGR48054.1 hypothetical protein SmphiM12_422 [Sinorhizobium phage phiM12]AKF12874.1 hypothetical protein PHIM7_329 [Sinorhizobium phage phiM7]AKF13234.1 hypothetical protein PHIM19_329 [Sinorhizobium phage phiM19]
MANKSKVENRRWIVERLAEIREGTHNLSYHLLREIERLRLIEPVFVKLEGRGRPIKTYTVTGEGRKLLGFSKNWRREAVVPREIAS